MEGGDCKKESNMMESVADVLRHAGSAFSLVRPKTEPGMETRTPKKSFSYLFYERNFSFSWDL
jgi:hypothetical protein